MLERLPAWGARFLNVRDASARLGDLGPINAVVLGKFALVLVVCRESDLESIRSSEFASLSDCPIVIFTDYSSRSMTNASRLHTITSFVRGILTQWSACDSTLSSFARRENDATTPISTLQPHAGWPWTRDVCSYMWTDIIACINMHVLLACAGRPQNERGIPILR